MKKRFQVPINKLFPWLLGGGIAVGSAALATHCQVPKTGKCSTCGSCLLALGSLVGWALLKNKDKDSIYSRTDEQQ